VLQVGSPLPVRYLPSNPDQSYPESDSPASQTHWSIVLPVAGMALFFMCSFAFIQLSAVLPKRRLLARGRAARGVVTGCKKGSRGRSTGYFLYFDFPLSTGGQGNGRVFRSQSVAVGSAVTVLYDPDHPRRNGVYPLGPVQLSAR
jgi:hypothetical protein